MTLSCSCAEFDPSEHDSWWEPGRRSVPPAGARCCECNAPLPDGERCPTILSHTVVETEEPEPPDFATVEDEDEAERLEAAWEAWAERNGWNSDHDRCETSEAFHRCERCGDLADAIEDMGFCMIEPGDLISAHEEYVNETQELAPGVARREIIWAKNKDDVWHPRRKTAADKRREEIRRRWRNAKYWLRYGWMSDLRWKVLFPARTRIMCALGYEWTYVRHDDAARKSIYRWQRKPRRLPPWQREAMKGREGA